MRLRKLFTILGLASTLAFLAIVELPKPKDTLARQFSRLPLHLPLNGQEIYALRGKEKESGLRTKQSSSRRSARLYNDGRLQVTMPRRGSLARDLDAFLSANRDVRVRNSNTVKVDIINMYRGPIQGNRVQIHVRWRGKKRKGKCPLCHWFKDSGSFSVPCSVTTYRQVRDLWCSMPAIVRDNVSAGYFPVR